MMLKSRNIITSTLMVLILFSTIGINIVSTFCDGCAIEQTSILILEPEDEVNCVCCSPEENQSCCNTQNHKDEHHKTKSFFAKLTFDSPQVKSTSLPLNPQVISLLFTSILFDYTSDSINRITGTVMRDTPPLGGRSVLSLVCILRN